jgi:hypothetical protein
MSGTRTPSAASKKIDPHSSLKLEEKAVRVPAATSGAQCVSPRISIFQDDAIAACSF